MKKSQFISSFGRRQDRRGARAFGGVMLTGYRNRIGIFGPELQLLIHTLVMVYFNDPYLKKFHEKVEECGGQVTVDHIDPSFDMKKENHYWRLQWASMSEQKQNQHRTTEINLRMSENKSKGLVQAREWHDRIKIGYCWTGGVPNDWEDDCVFVGANKAGSHTGHLQAQICHWLGDGNAHYCKANGKHWEYRRLEHKREVDYNNEEWVSPKEFIPNWPDGLQVSNLGRVNKFGYKNIGSKSGNYRKTTIDGETYRIHELMGWAFFGPRPSPNHTIDHKDKTLDSDGCLCNQLSNLLGWADRRQQCLTSRNGSNVETQGKPIWVRNRFTGTYTEYTDGLSAAKALGVSSGRLSDICRLNTTDNTFEAGYVKQPDLVYLHTKVVDGRVVCTTEVERWVEIDPKDWMEGGKYYCVRGKTPERKDVSKHASKRQRT